MGLWPALTAPAKILQISRFVDVGYPNARVVGFVLAGAAMAWGISVVRRPRDVWIAAGLAGFLVHAYTTLAAQVHENHLFAAMPFLAFAAAGRKRYLPLLVTLSGIFTLNLNLFYGVSDDVGYAIPRMLTPIDLTVVVAAGNCVALAWHALVLRREAGQGVLPTGGDTRPSPGANTSGSPRYQA
jgi:hypothetical protein